MITPLAALPDNLSSEFAELRDQGAVMFLHTRRAQTLHSLALVIVVGLFWGQPATAVNCVKNPSHPQCGGGGGSGGGGEDPPQNPAIAYGTWAGGSTVRVMDADGSNNGSIFDKHVSRGLGATEVRWSPGGDQVVYIERYNPGGGLYIANADGSNRINISPTMIIDGNETRIIASVGQPGLDWRDVDVSNIPGASGPLSRVFFLGAPEGNNSGHSAYFDVYTVDPTSTTGFTAHNLTNTDQSVRILDMTVSPDGRRVATRRNSFEDPYVNSDLIVSDISLVVGELKTVSDQDMTPAIKPNGVFTPVIMRWANLSDRLIYTENDLFVLDFSGTSTVTQLTGGNTEVQLGCEQAASWSPLDDQIVFDVQCVNKQVEGIYVGKLVGDPLSLIEVRKILRKTDQSRMDWRRTWTPTP